MTLPQNLGKGFAVIAIEYNEQSAEHAGVDDTFIVPFQADNGVNFDKSETDQGLRLMAQILRGHGFQVTAPPEVMAFAPPEQVAGEPDSLPDFSLPAPTEAVEPDLPAPNFGKRAQDAGDEGGFSFGTPQRAERKAIEVRGRKWADFSRADETDENVGLKPLI